MIGPIKRRTVAVKKFACGYSNFLTVYFNVSWPAFMATTGEAALKAQLYLAIVAQALVVKSDISTRRARNSFGTVTWQHNEIWPTVSTQAIGRCLCCIGTF